MSSEESKNKKMVAIISVAVILCLTLFLYSKVANAPKNRAKHKAIPTSPDSRAQAELIKKEKTENDDNFKRYKDGLFLDYSDKQSLSPSDLLLGKLRRKKNRSPSLFGKLTAVDIADEPADEIDEQPESLIDTIQSPPGSQGPVKTFPDHHQYGHKRSSFVFDCEKNSASAVPVENIHTNSGEARYERFMQHAGSERRASSALSFSSKSQTSIIYNAFSPVSVFEGDFLEGVVTREIVTDENESPVVVMTSRDFYDMEAKYVVIPSGTRVIGGAMAVSGSNANRLYIYFKRMILPNAVTVDFPTHAAALNASGSHGVVSKINRHFFRRFSSAIFYGFLGGVGGLAQNKLRATSPWSFFIDNAFTKIDRVTDSGFNQAQNRILPTIRIKSGTKIFVYLSFDMKITPYMKINSRRYAR